jgi:hypothetical protein
MFFFILPWCANYAKYEEILFFRKLISSAKAYLNLPYPSDSRTWLWILFVPLSLYHIISSYPSVLKKIGFYGSVVFLLTPKRLCFQSCDLVIINVDGWYKNWRVILKPLGRDLWKQNVVIHKILFILKNKYSSSFIFSIFATSFKGLLISIKCRKRKKNAIKGSYEKESAVSLIKKFVIDYFNKQ